MRERGGAKEMDNKWNTPSPFAPAERWGQTDTPQPYQKKKKLCETFPGRRQERRSESSWGEAVRIQCRRETDSGRTHEPEVHERIRVQGGHGYSALGSSSPGWIRLKEEQWSVTASPLLFVTMPSVSLSLPTALAGPARTWVCLSCMFWVRYIQDHESFVSAPSVCDFYV